MMRIPKPRIARNATLAALLLLGIGYFLQRGIDQRRPEIVDNSSVLVPSSDTVRRASLGYAGLAADIYWTRAVQYFGARRRQGQYGYPALAPLLNVAYDLDPDMTVAAEYGSLFLADVAPLGAGEPQQGIALLEKAIAHDPNRWQLYFNLGFIYALNMRDRRAAAEAFYRGSKIPHAHPVLKTLAALYFSEANDRPIARALWTDEYNNAKDKDIRDNALDHLQAMKVEDDIEHLESVAHSYQARFGHPPVSWQELISAGLLQGHPLDPQGHPYRLLPGGKFEVGLGTRIVSLKQRP